MLTVDHLDIFVDENLDKISKKIISGIVKVEGHFSEKDIKFLTVDANDIPELKLPTVPSLVYFKNGQPTFYEGKIEIGSILDKLVGNFHSIVPL